MTLYIIWTPVFYLKVIQQYFIPSVSLLYRECITVHQLRIYGVDRGTKQKMVVKTRSYSRFIINVTVSTNKKDERRFNFLLDLQYILLLLVSNQV